MKTKFLTLALLSLFIIPDVYAAKQFLLIGGGGEPTNKTDNFGNPITGMFDPQLENLRSFLNKSPSWQKEVSFNGGHPPKTESILANQYYDANPSSFTTTKYKQLIADYEQKLKRGDFAPGDQILIQIESHRARQY